MRHIPNPGHARELKPKVFDCERFRQAENQRAAQMSTGGFMLTAAKDNIFVVQSVGCQMRADARVQGPLT